MWLSLLFYHHYNYYHKFIPDAARLMKPLYDLLKKNTKFEWSDECKKAFNNVKTLLIKSPILRLFNPDKPIYLYTDASIDGIGAVLKQPQENHNLHPVG